MAVIFSATTILYSVPPVRLKKRLWVSNITIAVARSWFLLLAGWVILPISRFWEPTIWAVGTILFAFLMGASTTKDFTDLEGDRKHGMRTLPVVYGIERTTALISPFFLVPFLFIPMGVTLRVLPVESIQLTPLIGWAFYIVMILSDSATVRGKNFENSLMWVHMYLMMMALMAGFAAIFLLA